MPLYAVGFDGYTTTLGAYVFLVTEVLEMFRCECDKNIVTFENILITFAKCCDEKEGSATAKKFKKADKFSDIISLLMEKNICNWFDISILKRFAYQYDIPKVDDLIRDYENNLDPKKIIDISADVKKEIIGDNNFKKLRSLLSRTNCTVGDAKATFDMAGSIHPIAQSFMLKCIISQKFTSSQLCNENQEVSSAGYCIRFSTPENLPHSLEGWDKKCK